MSTATSATHGASDGVLTVVATTPSALTLILQSGNGVADEAEKKRARIAHVHHTLNERLHYVQSGKRMRDFAKWIQKSGGAKVMSTHGLDIDQSVLEAQQVSQLPITANEASKDTLFPEDKRNMDLVPILNLPNMFPGKALHVIDDRPPSLPRLLFRSIRLGIKFAPVTSTMWLALLSSTFRERIWYSWVASCLASSGPAFIKWGQWAATRSDMFPDTLCDELSHLHNDAPAHSWSFTQTMMESSLGLPRNSLLDVFESFDPVPVASGSIAQVHKAVLRAEGSTNGTLVAVKVRHPHVAQLIDMDFRLMSALASMIDFIPALSWLHLRESVEQFSHTMAAQAHLNVEAHHLEVLNDNFRQWDHVRFPEPIYASSSVIIETFEPGSIVSRILDVYDSLANKFSSERGSLTVEEVNGDGHTTEMTEGMGHELVPIKLAKFIVTTGLALYLKMLLVDNLMHADLHPGNILLDLFSGENDDVPPSSKSVVPLQDSAVHENLRVTLVDAGMVAQLTEEESSNFIGLLISLGEGDGRFAAECALRFSKKTDLNEQEREAFTDDLVHVFKERCGGYHTNVDVGHVLRGVLGMIRKHQVRIDANYATLVVNCLCVESLGRRVCPDYNVLDAAKPLLQTYRKMAYEKDWTPKKVSQTMVRRWIPLMNYRKNLQDNAFFSRRQRLFEAKQKTQPRTT